MSSTKKISKEKREIFRFEDYAYNQDIYFGRFMHFLDVINPIRFFISSSKIKEAQDKIKLKEEVAKNLGLDIYATKDEAKELLECQKI